MEFYNDLNTFIQGLTLDHLKCKQTKIKIEELLRQLRVLIQLLEMNPITREIVSCSKFLQTNNISNDYDRKYSEVSDLYLSLNNPICIKNNVKYLNANWNKDINRLNMLRKIQCYNQCKKLVEYSKSQPEQKTTEWLIKRQSYITASVVAVALNKNKYTSKFKSLCESSGIYPAFVGNEATVFGEKYEPVATKIYELDNNIPNEKKVKVFESAFIPSRDPRYFYIGGSPDGIVLETNIKDGKKIKDGYLIEIKCPFRRYPRGTVPEHYWMQMQIQMEVCDLERGYFLDFKIKDFEHFEDMLSYSSRNKFFHKGAVISIDKPIKENVVKEIKVYSPIYSYEEPETTVRDWVHKKIKRLNNYTVTYYLVTHKYYVEVFRNRKWLADNAKEIFQFWNDKQYYKKNFQELYEQL